MSPVRADWHEVTLGEVCQFKYGRSLPESDRAGGEVLVFGSNGPVGRHDKALSTGPTIVIGRKGSFGEVNFSPTACWPIDTTYYVDSSATRADLQWLAYRLKALGLNRLNRAAAVPGLNREDAYRQRLLLPPLTEQLRIAEILDKADALRAKRRAALGQLDTLTRSIFLDMFGDPATNPKRWRVLTLADVAATTSGGTPDRTVAEYFGGGIPWVKSGELHSGVVIATEESLTERGLAESSAKLMPSETVLVAMYGATVGAVAVLGIEAATNQAICCVQPTRELDVDYLVHLLRWLSPSLLAKRVGGAQPNLSQELLRRLRVPVPPLEVQRQFARRISNVAKLKAQCDASRAELDGLFASLQHRAFRGKL